MPDQERSFAGIEVAIAAQLMFRAMKEEGDGFPATGASGRTLGVRISGPSRDILIALDGTVSPGTGGMSVALAAAENLPKHRLPKTLGGEGRDPVFQISSASLPVSLLVDVDRYPHAIVEPAAVCPCEHYQENLWGTRLSWSRTHV